MCATPSATQLEPSLANVGFGDLICADEELLRAEFDAIVAAEWPVQPPRTGQPPGRAPDGPSGPRGVGATPVAAARRLPRNRRPGTPNGRRPRSPPGMRIRGNS